MSKCADCGLKQTEYNSDLCSECIENQIPTVEALLSQKLQEILSQMEDSLASVADDYRQTKDRWALGGMHQLSTYIIKLRKLV